ncbi:MAG: cardiolipin synthase B [Betaproteobacteria bacterium RBG_16_66_20]|nr:MAG: cardiolipin synthase B [Betaproteobacteria bacterium RBG_16_66_20]
MPDYVAGNRLTLLKNGEQYFPALAAAIDAAASEVFLETYIFADDQTGSLITDALARAAARGVATHLLIDGFGAKEFAPRFRSMLATAGAQVLVFRPRVSPWPLWKQRSRMRRMHRKLASIDGGVAFVGGINVVDDFSSPDPGPPQYDYAVRIEGPLVARVRAEAARLWTRVSWATLGRRWPGFALLLRGGAPRSNPQDAPVAGSQRAALVVRDSLRHRRDIENAYLEQIDAARSEVILANAYFFPTRRFRRALLQAAHRGVAVTLLLQGKADHPLQHYASRALYRTFLAAGIRIHEYHPSLLHAKVAVFDGRVATVGSSNIDPLSLARAREANVFVDDRAFAAELRGSLHEAIENRARAVPPNYWQRLSLELKARIWLSYRFARLLMTIYGFDRRR